MTAKVPVFHLFMTATALGASAWAQPGDSENGHITVIVGDSTPLYHACFEQARDGGNDYEALAVCDNSLEKEALTTRKRAVLHANRGVILYNIGDYDAAVEDFSRSLELGIHVRAKMLTNRGLTYEVLQFEALAKADYLAALEINENAAIAKSRLQELSKPLYERSRLPKRITAEAPAMFGPGI